jgi:hypothetical protein
MPCVYPRRSDYSSKQCNVTCCYMSDCSDHEITYIHAKYTPALHNTTKQRQIQAVKMVSQMCNFHHPKTWLNMVKPSETQQYSCRVKQTHWYTRVTPYGPHTLTHPLPQPTALQIPSAPSCGSCSCHCNDLLTCSSSTKHSCQACLPAARFCCICCVALSSHCCQRHSRG